ncbi:MAG: hypothetical protein QW046_03125 [Candidatus Micrarchaeaceae archaeon]
MPTITSNQVSVTVAGIPYSYSISLSASPTSLPSSGGTTTLTCTLTVSPSGGQLSGITITFTDQTTGSSGSAQTNSSGVATSTATLPANDTTSAEQYLFVASFSDPYTNAIINSTPVQVTVAAATGSLSLSVSPTSLPNAGGNITLTATLSGLSDVSGYTVTFVDVTTGTTIGTATTNSSGVATYTYDVPPNTSTSSETITFDATVTT